MLDATGVAGIGLTIAVMVPGRLVHPATAAVTEYIPLAAVVAFTMEGFCSDDVNAFGPVQE